MDHEFYFFFFSLVIMVRYIENPMTQDYVYYIINMILVIQNKETMWESYNIFD